MWSVTDCGSLVGQSACEWLTNNGLQLLGNKELEKTPRDKVAKAAQKPVKKAEEMTVEEAASKLQGMWRARNARRMLIKIIRENVQKVRGCC